MLYMILYTILYMDVIHYAVHDAIHNATHMLYTVKYMKIHGAMPGACGAFGAIWLLVCSGLITLLTLHSMGNHFVSGVSLHRECYYTLIIITPYPKTR